MYCSAFHLPCTEWNIATIWSLFEKKCECEERGHNSTEFFRGAGVLPWHYVSFRINDSEGRSEVGSHVLRESLFWFRCCSLEPFRKELMQAHYLTFNGCLYFLNRHFRTRCSQVPGNRISRVEEGSSRKESMRIQSGNPSPRDLVLLCDGWPVIRAEVPSSRSWDRNSTKWRQGCISPLSATFQCAVETCSSQTAWGRGLRVRGWVLPKSFFFVLFLIWIHSNITKFTT